MDGLSLHPVRIEHAPSIQRLFNDPKVTMFMPDGVPLPYELAHAVGFCESAMMNEEDGIGLHRSIFLGRNIVGYIGLTLRFDAHWGTAELGYWLGSNYFGQGIMPRAIRLITDEAFHSQPHLYRIHCSIPPFNRASCRAAEKAGYVHEATLKEDLYLHGKMVDECIYACRRSEWTFLE